MKKYIANIVYSGYMKNNEAFHIVEDMSLIDDRFPTLIIGWDDVKEMYPEASILDWKIDDNVFWTHKKNVKRTRYDEDMKKFKDLAIKRVNSRIGFNSVNLFERNSGTMQRFMTYLAAGSPKYCFWTDNELYVYEEGEDNVIGISLYEAEYMGYSREMIKKAMKSNGNTVVYNDFDIPKDIKFSGTYQKYTVPYLIWLFSRE